MAGLFGGGGSSNATTPVKLASIQVSTSMYGKPKPLVYGCTLLASNMIDYAGFTAHTQKSGGGKGGGGGSTTSYTYTADLILALCEGGASGIVGVNRVWRDKDCYTLSYYGLSLMKGSRPQSPWASWLSKWGSRALGYSGTAYVGVLQADLGSGGSIPNWNFEVQALLGTEQDPNYSGAYDAKPSAVVLDMLTNPYYGAGFTAARIADMVTGAASFQTYCTACGFAISPAFTDQSDAATCLQRILDATNSEVVWSAGASGMVLKFIPYGDTAITANGVTYTPNTTPIYDLTFDDFLGAVGKDGKPTGTDPIAVSRSSVQDIKNDVPVEFWDRTNAYNVSTVDTPEPSDVSMNGLKQDSPLTLHLITRASHAQQISAIRAQRNVYVRNTYTFKVGWKCILLEPMDLVTLTDAITGLTKKIVRIISVEMPDETSEEDGLTITAEEWPFGIGTATQYATQIPAGNNAGQPAASAVEATAIFEPPVSMTDSGSSEIWFAAAGLAATWGGCNVWASLDGGNSYGTEPIGVIHGSARIGSLTAALASSADPDTTDTLAVSLAASQGNLNSTTAAGRDSFTTGCMVGSEVVSYLTATLTAANAYNLTSLRRGGYGSTIAAHSSGAPFVFLDDTLLKLTYSSTLVGVPIYFKFQSFNAVGTGLQDLSTCTPYSYTPVGVVFPNPGTGIGSGGLPPNIGTNTANNATVSGGYASGAGTISIYGPGGAGTAWTFYSGSMSCSLPAATITGLAVSTVYYALYNIKTQSYSATTSYSSILPDNVIVVGSAKTGSSTGGGTTGGGGTGTGGIGCTVEGVALDTPDGPVDNRTLKARLDRGEAVYLSGRHGPERLTAADWLPVERAEFVMVGSAAFMCSETHMLRVAGHYRRCSEVADGSAIETREGYAVMHRRTICGNFRVLRIQLEGLGHEYSVGGVFTHNMKIVPQV
jgi:hypothetical protein